MDAACLYRKVWILLSTATAFLLAPNTQGLVINQWTGNVNTSWNNSGNWLEGNVPNTNDQATIYSGTVNVNSTPGNAGGLLDDGDLHLNGHSLTINGAANVDSGSLYANGTFNAGRLTYDGGLLSAGSATSTVTVSITFTLAGSAGTSIATIDANGQSMTVNATTFELHDYNTEFDVSASGGSLDLEGTPDYASPSGNIGATIYVGASSQISYGVGEWLFGYYQKSGGGFVSHGSLNLNGGTSSSTAAKVNDYGIYFTSVNVTGYGTMAAGEFDGGCNVNVASGGVLTVNGPYFRGTATSPQIFVNGPGTVDWNGNTGIGYSNTSVPYTEVDVEAGVNFDWDGTSNANASCDIQNGELDIYSSTLSGGGLFNAYQGQLTVEGGSKLNVAGNSWLMVGPITLGPGAIITGQTMFVGGGGLPAGEYAITPQTHGGSAAIISAPLEFDSGTIFFPSTDSLRLDGATDYAGGSVGSGPYVQGTQPYGTLIQNGNATVDANTTIFCNTLDMDGSSDAATWTINAGVTLKQQAWFLDSANSTTNPFHSTITINGGTLDMETNAGQWTLTGGTINMSSSGTNNPTITHDKLILGSGSTNGTINVVGVNTTAYISGGLQSAANSVAGGNVIQNAGILVIDSAFGSDANAVLTINGGLVYITGTQTHKAGATINFNQGELILETNAGTAATGTLNLNVGAAVVAFDSNQHLASLHLQNGSFATLGSGADEVLRTSSLIIDGSPSPTGTLDIGDEGLIIDYSGSSPLTTIGGYIAAAYDHGKWDQSGLYSSAANTKTGTAIGYADNNQFHYLTFDNQTVSLNTILVKYTWYGDLNLDGKVNGSDLALMNTGAGWSHGDLNYDGVINADDWALFALGNAAQDGSIPVSVPEPGVAAVLGIGGLALRRRRCRALSR